MSHETRDLAIYLRDRFQERARISELYARSVAYLFQVFEDIMSEMRRELIEFGGDGNQIKFYRDPDARFIVLKMGPSLTTLYAMSQLGLSPVGVEGTSGLCGRVIVFNGDYRTFEVEDEEQLATIEENSLFVFAEGANTQNVLLYHIVPPVGLHATDWNRFALLTLESLARKTDSHYSPILEQILAQSQGTGR